MWKLILTLCRRVVNNPSNTTDPGGLADFSPWRETAEDRAWGWKTDEVIALLKATPLGQETLEAIAKHEINVWKVERLKYWYRERGTEAEWKEDHSTAGLSVPGKHILILAGLNSLNVAMTIVHEVTHVLQNLGIRDGFGGDKVQRENDAWRRETTFLAEVGRWVCCGDSGACFDWNTYETSAPPRNRSWLNFDVGQGVPEVNCEAILESVMRTYGQVGVSKWEYQLATETVSHPFGTWTKGYDYEFDPGKYRLVALGEVMACVHTVPSSRYSS